MQKDTILTHDDFLNFINWLPKIQQFKVGQYGRAPMSSEAFQLMYKLMFYCALKVIEVRKLRKKDFDLEKNLVVVNTGGNRPSHTTIPPIILGELKNHFKNKDDSDFIFTSKKTKKPVDRSTPWIYAKDAGEKAGLNVFQIKAEMEIEGMSLLLFRNSYERFMSDNQAPKGLIDLKLRRPSDNKYGNHTLHDLKKFERDIFKTTLSDDEVQSHLSWYVANRETYEDLADEVYAILTGVLKQRKIDVADIQVRAKTAESFRRKLMDGITFEPQNMNDLAGIRIICFVKSDVDRISDVIKETFDVIGIENKEKAIDFSGYLDVKYVCKLPKARLVPAEELRRFEKKHFEIQIRTILQHAWAEIEHDDIYKNPYHISTEIRKRFFLVSKVLEMTDNELDSLHRMIKKETQ